MFASLEDGVLLRFSPLHYFILNMENYLFAFVVRLIYSLQLNSKNTPTARPEYYKSHERQQ